MSVFDGRKALTSYIDSKEDDMLYAIAKCFENPKDNIKLTLEAMNCLSSWAFPREYIWFVYVILGV